MITETLMHRMLELVEQGRMPDFLTRMGIRRLCRQRLDEHGSWDDAQATDASAEFARSMRQAPIALVPEKANEQHYELPPEFFSLVLGRHRKYSCCEWVTRDDDLDTAEANALRSTCTRAGLEDGQTVLELGCGWGSLTLWMAEHYPRSVITAVSNSAPQRVFIEEQARQRGLSNVRVITADMNRFDIEDTFDRVVSVEMFEHMRNYETLLRSVSTWLVPEGRAFVHIFCHRRIAYAFDTEGAANWMGRYFFSGGIMPSFDLLRQFDKDMCVAEQVWWSGVHYQRTAEAWLSNLDRRRSAVMPILEVTYGAKDAERWFHRWRVFFLACAELFGYAGGREWGVTHCVLKPTRHAARQPTVPSTVGAPA